MSAEQVIRRLRQFLLGLAGLMCAGTVAELVMAEHTKDPVQFIPFTLCGLALAALVAVWRWPGRATIVALRGVMVLVALGSAFGIYEHLANNVAFELDIRPGATLASVWWQALHGAAPLLAPGTLAMMGAVALAAVYQHPAERVPAAAQDTGRANLTPRPPSLKGRGSLNSD